MALRLIEIVMNEKSADSIHDLLKDQKILDHEQLPMSDGQVLVRILLNAEQNEPVLDELKKYQANGDSNRIIVLPVEATLPRAEPEPAVKNEPQPERMSREELYEDIKDSSRCTKVYISMIILSTIVAAIGLQENNVAIIIGAMVIAPMLGPSMAMALATTLGDLTLLRNSLQTALIGVAAAMLFSVFIGMVVHVDPATVEIAARTKVGLGAVALAFASGCAGALAFTSGVSATLIGVMVAVALLPPLVTSGLLLGAGHVSYAFDASLLFMINIVSVNVAAVSIFLVQGISPLTWWEKDRAKQAVRITMILYVFTIITLLALIFYVKRTGSF